MDITDPGTGTFNMIGQDAAFTKLAHQYVTSDSGTDRYNILDAGNIPRPWTTLLVRVVEAPSVSFISGGDLREPVPGRRHRLPDGQQSARWQRAGHCPGARRSRVPGGRTSSGVHETKWGNGTADGVLILDVLKDNAGNVRPYTFTAGATLFAGGPPSGVNVATAGVPAAAARMTSSGRGATGFPPTWGPIGRTAIRTPIPSISIRGGISRSQIFWPPDDKTATAPVNDKYTAVRFGDSVNPAYCTAFFSRDNSAQGGQAGGDIIRMQSPDGVKFYSPQSWSWLSTKPEVGLHAYGLNITSIYFDEFGLQFGPPASAARQSFIMPIQK